MKSNSLEIPRAAAASPAAAFVFMILMLGGTLAHLLAGGPFASGVIPGQGFIRWNPEEPVRYLVDRGPLSNIEDNNAGTELVEEAFAHWEAIPTAELTTQNLGQLQVNVNADNFENFVGVANEPVSIIFDQDGSLINDFLGAGSSATVLGFAAPTNANNQNQYTSGFIVLNGPLSRNNPGFIQTVTHELGHLLGLDHTQVNRRFEGQCPFQGPCLHEFVPVMYPFGLPGQRAEPSLDDAAWFSFIYPSPEFSTQLGEIRGRALRANGLPMQSGFVTAALLEEGAGEPELSDSQLVGGVAEFQLNGDGRFILPGLPPGDYVVFIEPVDPRFTEGSSVGPFDFADSRQNDYPRDFFNGDGESAEEDPLLATIVSVEAGETVDNINIIVNSPPQNDSGAIPVTLGDDDFQFFDFPDGFAFPFFGRVYGQMLIHSDGNITFIEDDATSDARSLARLIFSSPRIAPLFTDLNPQAGGSVRVVVSQSALRVEWNDVPEFGGFLGNTFSVTLRST
ncbi:MAG TPA: hypothetical protein VLV83_01665, partial [Acidobacteriota bacterium]|nr:hypothetical protein [Acidobacteriota bacterium]